MKLKIKKDKYLSKLRKDKMTKTLLTKRRLIIKKLKDEKEKSEELNKIKYLIEKNKKFFKDFENLKNDNIYNLKIFCEFFLIIENFQEKLVKNNFQKLEYEFSPKKILFNLLSYLETNQKLENTDTIYDLIIYISFYFEIKMNENDIFYLFNKFKMIKNPFLFCGKLSFFLNNFSQDNKKFFFLFEEKIWDFFLSALNEKISEENFFMILKNFKIILSAFRKIDNLSKNNLKQIFILLINFYLDQKFFIEIIPILTEIKEIEIDYNFEKFLNLMFEIFSKEENKVHDENCLKLIEIIFKFENYNFEKIFLLNYKEIINKIVLLTKKKNNTSDLCFKILDLILNRFGDSYFENLNLDFLEIFLINLLNFENTISSSFFTFCKNVFGFCSYQKINIQKLIVFIEVLIEKYIYFFNEKIIITQILKQIFEMYHENNFKEFMNFFKKIHNNKKFLMFFDGNEDFTDLDLSEIIEDFH